MGIQVTKLKRNQAKSKCHEVRMALLLWEAEGD